jgi:HAD superfamily hydrolase (TIGR01509 family)
MQNKKNIKAILFDNDGVLVSTESVFWEANNYTLSEIFSHKNLEQTHDDFAYYCLGASGGSRRFLQDHGFSDDEINAFRQHRNAYYLKTISRKNRRKSGVLQTIKTLHKKFRLNVVTNSSTEHFNGVHASTELLPFFEVVVTRDDVRLPKPDPEPYLLALQKLNLSAEQAIVVEDSTLGIQAGQAAGIFTIGIRDPFNRTADISAADANLLDITELVQFLHKKQTN